MKKNLTTVFSLLALLLLASACSNEQPAIISGTWNRAGSEKLSLFKTISGRLEEVATCKLDSNGLFAFAFYPPAESFYVIGTGEAESGEAGKYTFYFKPGDRAQIAVNDSSYTLTGNNTKENKALTAWHDYIRPLEYNALYYYKNSYGILFPLLEEKTATPYKAAATGNKTFDSAFEKYRKFNVMYYAITFLLTPRTAHPGHADDYSAYYHTINVDDITANTDVLNYPYGDRILSGCFFIPDLLNNVVPDFNIDRLIAITKNDTLKGELVLSQLAYMNEYQRFLDMLERYQQYMLTGDQQQRVKKQREDLATKYNESPVGKPAIDFKHKDRNGKLVALSDFKGKVVLVDVWATWCGPCKRELPYLKELEKKYHGRDVVFLGVSVDEAKDYKKWEQYLDKEGLQGIQLFGGNGFHSDIARLYQINAIPRFILVDKEGKIVFMDAPAPSSGELAYWIDKQL